MSRGALAAVVGAAVAAATYAVVAIVTDDDDPATTTATSTTAAAPSKGRAVYASMGCGSCHTLAAARSTGTIGPDLDERLPGHTRESLTAVILDPPAPMPSNFDERLTDEQLDVLVGFLLESRG